MTRTARPCDRSTAARRNDWQQRGARGEARESGVLGEDGFELRQGGFVALLRAADSIFRQAHKHFLIGLIERLARRAELLRDGLALVAALDHGLNAAHLPLDAGQALEQGIAVLQTLIIHSFNLQVALMLS